MHDASFHQLQNAMQALRQSRITIAQFCVIWRAQHDLLTALPTRFGTVMDDLLSRLEAGSLFTEESCSFSQIDLLATLDTWLSKAREQLNKKD